MRWRSAAVRGVSGVALVGALAGCGAEPEAEVRLAAAAELPGRTPPGTRLRLGDPTAQLQLELMGAAGELPFRAEWQNISGGPLTLEAFRAGALDGGAVGDTPPIHAHFTGLDVKIVAVELRERPIYQLALAPGAGIASLAELGGRRIAYSPGQAQGALVLRVLRRLGLPRSAVQLVELGATEFRDALASRQVDVAPLSGPTLQRYLGEYGREGARALPSGARDNLSFFYAPAAVLRDAGKAAALREYVRRRAQAQRWAAEHAQVWLEAYYVKNQGLSPEQARFALESSGFAQPLADWSEAIALTQETIELLAEASGRTPFDARELFDLRFASAAADAAPALAAPGAPPQRPASAEPAPGASPAPAPTRRRSRAGARLAALGPLGESAVPAIGLRTGGGALGAPEAVVPN